MSRRHRRAVIAGVVSALVVVATRAEVSLTYRGRQSRPEVVVRTTPLGPWTCLRPANGFVLNPDGDRLGDGFPGHASSRERAVAAWVRPGLAGVLVASADNWGWSAPTPVPASSPVESPLVRSLESGWAVVWQEGGPNASVRVAWLAEGGTVGDTQQVADGALISAVSQGDSTLHVVSLSTRDRVVTVTTIVVLASPNWPIPIDWSATALGVVAVRGTVSVPIPVVQVAAAHRGVHAPASAGGGVRVHEGEWRGEEYALVTWWASASELQFVELDEDGPVLPVESLETPAGAPFSPALVAEALRIVRDRQR